MSAVVAVEVAGPLGRKPDTVAMSEDLELIVTRWARRRADVHALVLVGSRARTHAPADAWSDHDFIVVVDDDASFLDSTDWVAEVGTWVLSFVEAAAAGGVHERRVLFADGADADFAFVSLAQLDDVAGRPDVPSVFARGFRVLVDKGVLGDLPTAPVATDEDLSALAHEFWYRAIWTARKLHRGELHVAIQGCNCGLRAVLERALRVDARAAGRDAWHEGRFLERWADPEWLARMSQTIAQEDPAEASNAIRAASDLFSDVCAALRERHGLEVRMDLPAVRRQLDAALAS
jgi:aminoglycoside 6-adenylyltransferase